VNGGAQCWGDNVAGQLGIDAGNSQVPVAVPGLESRSGVQTIAAGSSQACALVAGGVQCWGNIYWPEDDLPRDDPALATVLGLGWVQAISAGWAHTCALVDGGVQCWGDDQVGQLGYNSPAWDEAPVAVQGLGSGAEAIAAGGYFTCALVSGGVQCWGSNSFGQLGNNSSSPSSLLPVAVQGLGPGSGVQAMAAGFEYACAVVNGGAQCWGNNQDGQLGNGSRGESAVPVPVQGLGPGSGVQGIAASGGGEHTCAAVAGGVQCWGDNDFGDLGNGSLAPSAVPVGVVGLGPGSGVQAVAVGGEFSCALLNGVVECWGNNTAGQLGNGSDAGQSLVPVPVAPWAQ
jgi:alpha-tubulin suppressor-like RCC1 family protein